MKQVHLLLKSINLEVAHVFIHQKSVPGSHRTSRGAGNCSLVSVPNYNPSMEWERVTGGHCRVTLWLFAVCTASSLSSTPPSLGLVLFQPMGEHVTLLGSSYFMEERVPQGVTWVLGEENLTFYQIALSCLGLIGAPGGLGWASYSNILYHT